jgi:undecaprenyl-diphosphatase
MLEAIFLGLLQGLTEFLPISSSAHLRIAGEFLPRAGDPGATFTAITQIGTEIAVLIYFRKDLFRIARGFLQALLANFGSQKEIDLETKSSARMGWMIIVGSLPILVLGYLGQETIRTTFRSLWLIAATLIFFGLLLGYLDYKRPTKRSMEELSFGHALFYGFAQSLALVPGVSRSGATIAMGRFLKYDRVSALRFSFLLAIPAVLASGFNELFEAIENPGGAFTLGETFAATIVAFFVGYMVIAWLMKFISTKSFAPFVIYRVVLGSALLFGLASGFLQSA